ncbi:hypothetical protein [Nostoc sp.]|uniref:hypothetical protein n=1 Tax=Nostoc sp. TaxID=1180 RepID=UPI002FF69995
MASPALLSPALSTCSAVSCNSGKMEEAIAQEFLTKYLGGRFEPLGDIPGHSELI